MYMEPKRRHLIDFLSQIKHDHLSIISIIPKATVFRYTRIVVHEYFRDSVILLFTFQNIIQAKMYLNKLH